MKLLQQKAALFVDLDSCDAHLSTLHIPQSFSDLEVDTFQHLATGEFTKLLAVEAIP